jgi:hypothetical protein
MISERYVVKSSARSLRESFIASDVGGDVLSFGPDSGMSLRVGS